MATGARSGRSEVQGIDGAPVTVDGTVEIDSSTPVDVAVTGQPISIDDNGGSITVDGTVDVGNPCSDTEQVILTDTGAVPEQDFLRTYEYDCDGDLVGFTDTELDGSTAYAPVGPIEVSVRAARPRDIEQDILCDDQGGGTVVPFLRRYRWNPNGTLQSTADLDLDGVAYAPSGTVRKCEADDQGPVEVSNPTGSPIEVDITTSDCDSQAVQILCDVQVGGAIVRFIRVYPIACDGTPGAPVDLDLAGGPYVITGTVVTCGQATQDGVQSGYGGDPIYTRIFGAFPSVGSSYTTSANARRVQVFWTSTAASLGNRASLSIAGGPFTALPNNVGLIEFGTLTTSTVLGYTISLRTNQNSDDAGILEEF